MSFRILGLDPAPFAHLFWQPEDALASQGVLRCIVQTADAYPDRIELRDAALGESVLLLNYTHQPAATPFRASHAIYLREGATQTYDARDEVPEMMRRRLISLRGFDAQGMLRNADVSEGDEIAACIKRLFRDHNIAYLHAHFAKHGCYAARIERA